MFKIFISTITALLCVHLASAQHLKLSLMQGVGIDNNKNTDSLFFAKSYSVSQLRLGYHFGKLGFISNTTFIWQNNQLLQQDKRLPEFVLIGSTSNTIDDLSTICTTLGLELCLPLAKRKMQANMYATAGVAATNKNRAEFLDVTVPIYGHYSTGAAVLCLQAGGSFNYKINPHLAVKVQEEWIGYSIPYTEVDLRKTATASTGKQRKNLFASTLGIQYKF
jgi:hypothetical protein